MKLLEKIKQFKQQLLEWSYDDAWLSPDGKFYTLGSRISHAGYIVDNKKKFHVEKEVDKIIHGSHDQWDAYEKVYDLMYKKGWISLNTEGAVAGQRSKLQIYSGVIEDWITLHVNKREVMIRFTDTNKKYWVEARKITVWGMKEFLKNPGRF